MDFRVSASNPAARLMYEERNRKKPKQDKKEKKDKNPNNFKVTEK